MACEIFLKIFKCKFIKLPLCDTIDFYFHSHFVPIIEKKEKIKVIMSSSTFLFCTLHLYLAR